MENMSFAQIDEDKLRVDFILYSPILKELRDLDKNMREIVNKYGYPEEHAWVVGIPVGHLSMVVTPTTNIETLHKILTEEFSAAANLKIHLLIGKSKVD